MELLILAFLLITGLAIWALVALWRKLGGEHPFVTALLGLAIGSAPLLLVCLAFGINPLEPYFGILLIGPTFGAALAGMFFLLFAVVKGLLRSRSTIAGLYRHVLDDRQS